MTETSAFDMYVAKGKTEGELRQAQKGLLLLGRKKFGEPDSATEDALRQIVDMDRLMRMTGAILEANSWTELLSTQ